ncbi:ADP-forming succinate--CoA ligase subunit beta, partial [Chloroflexota bacterium]
MKLFEFEAKDILKKYGILIPQGELVSKPSQAKKVVQEIGKPAVLKSQILVSGRGKSGGIVFVSNAAKAREAAAGLLGSKIKGCLINRLLVEERLDIASQFYASLAIDRQARTYVALASASGGIDIEEFAKASPDRIARHWIDVTNGFSKKDALGMLSRFSMDKADADSFAAILETLYEVTLDYDAELVEINPLVKTQSGAFAAADARIIVDDNAVFRHPELTERGLLRAEDTPREAEARKQGLTYVDLDGEIGIIGNGAGLVMATIDMVSLYGGRPGSFLDLGGGSPAEIARRGIMLVMAKPEIKAVLINILGGITRCDLVAEAIVQVLGQSDVQKQLVIRITGTNEDEATDILRQAGISSYRNMEE